MRQIIENVPGISLDRIHRMGDIEFFSLFFEPKSEKKPGGGAVDPRKLFFVSMRMHGLGDDEIEKKWAEQQATQKKPTRRKRGG